MLGCSLEGMVHVGWWHYETCQALNVSIVTKSESSTTLESIRPHGTRYAPLRSGRARTMLAGISMAMWSYVYIIAMATPHTHVNLTATLQVRSYRTRRAMRTLRLRHLVWESAARLSSTVRLPTAGWRSAFFVWAVIPTVCASDDAVMTWHQCVAEAAQ